MCVLNGMSVNVRKNYMAPSIKDMVWTTLYTFRNYGLGEVTIFFSPSTLTPNSSVENFIWSN